MIEKIIELEDINLVDFFGVNNSKIDLIKNMFPKIKIIARGNLLKIMGEINDVNLFEDRFNYLLQHFNKHNIIHEDEIIMLMSSEKKQLDNIASADSDVIAHSTTGKPIRPKTPNQIIMVNEFYNNDLIFAVGPAGTGKTYIAIALAVRALKNKEVKRIVLSRPAVEAGENLGFLPGDMKDKLDPYLQALYDALYEMIPAKKLQTMMEDRIIEIAPLAYMRGRTLSNAIVILDEAQNSTSNQMKMFLTRMGENSKFIVTGDITQIDLPTKQKSGLNEAITLLKDIKNIKFIFFGEQDVVRHPIVKKIIAAYDKKNN